MQETAARRSLSKRRTKTHKNLIQAARPKNARQNSHKKVHKIVFVSKIEDALYCKSFGISSLLNEVSICGK